MSEKFTNAFYFIDWSYINGQADENPTDAEKYKRITDWAGKAREQNPNAFDALTEWILDDSAWSGDKLAENEQILMQGVIARFKEQNAKLRTCLKELAPSGVVNAAVFDALDRLDNEMSGKLSDEKLRKSVAAIFADFSAMRERSVREMIAGNKTGADGVNHVELFGYINCLKNCDAGVQWTLFMPEAVEEQQKGFKMDRFEYQKMPAMRFVGKEGGEHESMEWRLALMRTLDALTEHKSGFDYDVLFQHHYGKCVDVERWHGFWGRFMKADTPVPEGYVHWDFVPDDTNTPHLTFRSQFAFAIFSGDNEAIHKRAGYDCDAMYDVTRNTILGQNVCIPYPEIYWTAEVFLDGCDKNSNAYMFSVAL